MNGLPGSWRRSRLTDGAGAGDRFLVWADLHNHSTLSDGLGDPERAFAQLRAAGLDAAALTDHASIPRDQLHRLHPGQYPDAAALALARSAPVSLDPAGWARTGELADAHDRPGEFSALRGFEWTEPWLGHVNVWFAGSFLPVTTPGSLHGLQEFLREAEPDALFGYNHPGREPGRLAGFELPDSPGLAGRMVALEAFNRTEDFLFGGHDRRARSPLVDCLDAGWRPGLVGSSDEHGRSYGLAGKGRTGLWVHELSRSGLRAALLARRSFATRESGLRLDASLDGVPMGGLIGAAGGRHELAVDLALPDRDGLPVELQLLASDRQPSAAAPDLLAGGSGPATLLHRGLHQRLSRGVARGVSVLARTPARVGAVTRAELDLPVDAGWLLLRVADPARSSGSGTAAGHPADSWALGYGTPWWCEP